MNIDSKQNEIDYTNINYKDVNIEKNNDIIAKINLFMIVLSNDKLIYYNKSIFNVIKFLNESKLYNINTIKHNQICKIIYHTYFTNNLYDDDDMYYFINRKNADNVFNYIVYCNNNNIINDKIIKLMETFLKTDQKDLLKEINWHYFNQIYYTQKDDISNNIKLFNEIIFIPKIKIYHSLAYDIFW